MEWLMRPWPWYIGGPLIGLTVPLLYILAGKSFGLSSSFRHIGALCTPNTKLAYLRYNWRDHAWSLVIVAGIVVGAFIANRFLAATPLRLLPDSYYSFGGVIRLIVGGLLVGFGTRYADGCTSGHTITGISHLNWPSLVASISFFVGGLLTTGLLTWLLK